MHPSGSSLNEDGGGEKGGGRRGDGGGVGQKLVGFLSVALNF